MQSQQQQQHAKQKSVLSTHNTAPLTPPFQVVRNPRPRRPPSLPYQPALRRAQTVILAAVAHLLPRLRVNHIICHAPGQAAPPLSHQLVHVDHSRAAAAAAGKHIARVLVHPGGPKRERKGDKPPWKRRHDKTTPIINKHVNRSHVLLCVLLVGVSSEKRLLKNVALRTRHNSAIAAQCGPAVC